LTVYRGDETVSLLRLPAAELNSACSAQTFWAAA